MKYYAGIIGSGVAGSTMALRLAALGYSVVLLSKTRESDSSRVAAGLLNPFAPKHLLPGWRGMEFADEAHRFYRELQTASGVPFYDPMPIFRVFPNDHYRGDWQKRCLEHPEYLSPVMDAPDPAIKAPFGGGLLYHSGVADGKAFLQATETQFAGRVTYIQEDIRYEELRFEAGHWHYRDLRFEQLLFCEGMAARQNPYLQQMELIPLKGDLLRLRLPGFEPEYIYQTQHFIAPDPEPGVFKVGSTYQLGFQSPAPQEGDLNFLLGALQSFYKGPYELLEHRAGLRPTSFDRRPYAGAVPGLQQAWVLNGLGSKGYLMTPLLSRVLCDTITGQGELWPELDPGRRRKRERSAG